MDETGFKILEMLSNTPGISQKDVAKALKVTPPAITNRLKKMREDGIIMGFLPVVDLGKLGFRITMLSNLRVRYDRVEEAVAWFAKSRNVCAVYHITGAYDMLIVSKFRDTKEFSEWVKEANLQKGKDGTSFMERMNSSLVFNTAKESLAPAKLL
ncbi:MAG: winged helix-turn-helix transcriptional regulator [Candidatus Diapherotrites archaeon]|nr:winged helix-turn-helix transcriptional regulator [Candidatus Diapherotrites archaeon]